MAQGREGVHKSAFSTPVSKRSAHFFLIDGNMLYIHASLPSFLPFRYQNKSDQSNVNPKAPIYVVTGAAGSHELHEPFTRPQPEWSAFRSNSFGYSKIKVYVTKFPHPLLFFFGVCDLEELCPLESVASYLCRFVLTCTHSDDSSKRLGTTRHICGGSRYRRTRCFSGQTSTAA